MNFALILFCLLLASGAIWMADVVFFRKHRAPGAKDPWWVEYGASFFPVILVVFVLRSFVVEPFKIVITSYSIHYTKLYDASGWVDQQPLRPRCGENPL